MKKSRLNNHNRIDPDAQRKLKIVQGFERFRSLNISKSKSFNRIVTDYCQRHGVPGTTFRRWIERYEDRGADGLADRRGGNKSNEYSISTGAFNLFRKFYLNRQRLTVRICWRFVNFINEQEKRKWNVPSLRVMYNVVKRRIPEPVIVLRREGRKACQARHGKYLTNLIIKDCDGKK